MSSMSMVARKVGRSSILSSGLARTRGKSSQVASQVKSTWCSPRRVLLSIFVFQKFMLQSHLDHIVPERHALQGLDEYPIDVLRGVTHGEHNGHENG